MKVRVNFKSCDRPIGDIAVQCPKCGKWFDGQDISDYELKYEYQIEFARFVCPICSHVFTGFKSDLNHEKIEIEEVNTADECYNGCLRQKIIWE